MLRYIFLLYLLVRSNTYTVYQNNNGQSVENNLKVRNEVVPPSNSIDTRIVGGKEAKSHDYPFMVGLTPFFLTPKEVAGTCGGELINEFYVLTAAHCVHYNSTGRLVHQVLVNLGDHNNKIKEAGEKTKIADSKDVIVHDRFFKDKTVAYDIALIYLCGGVKLSRTIQTVCLASPGSTYVNKMAKAIGWGITESASLSTVLKQVDIQIVEDDECSEFETGVFRFQPDVMICGGLTGQGSSCTGDSGGPLLVQRTNNSFTVVGITSFSAETGCTTYSSVFTKVSSFIPWIRKNIHRGTSFCIH